MNRMTATWILGCCCLASGENTPTAINEIMTRIGAVVVNCSQNLIGRIITQQQETKKLPLPTCANTKYSTTDLRTFFNKTYSDSSVLIGWEDADIFYTELLNIKGEFVGIALPKNDHFIIAFSVGNQ